MPSHLSCHESMCNTEPVKVLLDFGKIHLHLFINDKESRTCSQRRIQVHHAGIKTKACIRSHC